MKHSTFYTDDKGSKHVYTTIKLTDHHKFMRERFNGRTYEHEDDAKLYFAIGMPLDEPLTFKKEIKD